MKKDKAVRNAEMKSALKNWIKSLAGPMVILLIIVAGILVVALYRDEEEVADPIEVKGFLGEEEILVLENDNLKFELDTATTQFTVTNKSDGTVWYSNPPGADEDPIALPLEKSKLKSTIVLTYSTVNGVDTIFNNYDYSMSKGLYEIEQGDDYIKVYYSIGNVQKEFVIPKVISEARMDALTAAMDNGTKTRVTGYYKKYDINKLGKKDNKEELLASYPILANEVAYVLRDSVGDNVKGMLQDIFGEAGYTYEEYLEDMGEGGEQEAAETPLFNINMVYRLDGDKLVVEVPFDEIEYREKYPIYYLNILPYMGAGGTQDSGYLLVPEGGGGIINFNNGKTAQSAYYANMYGWDYAQYRDAVVHETNTYFNAFGIANNGSSFLCVLEQTAPYAGITAEISGMNNSYNTTYAQYTMVHREVYEVGERYESKIYMYQDGLPSETLVQSYRFIDSEDYSDMALAYRKYLQEEFGELLTEQQDQSTPMVIEILGAADKVKQVVGIPMTRPLELTTFREAQNILAQLQQDGVQNMSVKLSGWMNGGVQQRILKNVHLVSDLGSKKDLKNLTTYASENGIDLYLDGITNYAYDSDFWDGFVTYRDAARFASKEKAEIHPYSTVTYSAREGQEPHYLLKSTLIPEMVDNLSAAADTYGANVSFSDIGKDLSSDFYKKNPASRQSMLDSQVAQLNEIKSDGKKIMINMGNNYAIGYSDIVTNMDMQGSDYTILDATVPVYQMAIHGYVNYTGESLNMTQNQEEELLRSAEYGAGLAFTLMDESAFTLQNTLYTQYFGAEYDTARPRLLEIYNRYNQELGHIFNQKMTDHTMLSTNLTCTEYEDGTKVYVNYGYDVLEIPEGQSIPARDYLVIR